MKKVILTGNVASGKTTLCQYLSKQEIKYKKTQAVEVVDSLIDTPGEFFQHRSYLRALVSCAADTEIMLFVLDPTQEQVFLRPGLAATFLMDVIGVITKIDIASSEQIERGREFLRLAGATTIFEVSAYTGDGMERLSQYLSQ